MSCGIETTGLKSTSRFIQTLLYDQDQAIRDGAFTPLDDKYPLPALASSQIGKLIKVTKPTDFFKSCNTGAIARIVTHKVEADMTSPHRSPDGLFITEIYGLVNQMCTEIALDAALPEKMRLLSAPVVAHAFHEALFPDEPLWEYSLGQSSLACFGTYDALIVQQDSESHLWSTRWVVESTGKTGRQKVASYLHKKDLGLFKGQVATKGLLDEAGCMVAVPKTNCPTGVEVPKELRGKIQVVQMPFCHNGGITEIVREVCGPHRSLRQAHDRMLKKHASPRRTVVAVA